MHCPACGASQDESNRYCPRCGSTVAGSSPVQQVVTPPPQPPYPGYPPYPYMTPMPRYQRIESYLLASMVLGITSVFFYPAGVILGILAIVFYINGKRRIQADPTLGGQGMAGLVTGIVGLTVSAAFWIIVAVAAAHG